jgi:predicted amidohydrolase
MPFEFVGDILIEGGKIFEVLPSIEINVQSCEAIDVRGDIVIPGFVDTHRHTWQAPLRYVGTDWTISQYVEGCFAGSGLTIRPRTLIQRCGSASRKRSRLALRSFSTGITIRSRRRMRMP